MKLIKKWNALSLILRILIGLVIGAALGLIVQWKKQGKKLPL